MLDERAAEPVLESKDAAAAEQAAQPTRCPRCERAQVLLLLAPVPLAQVLPQAERWAEPQAARSRFWAQSQNRGALRNYASVHTDALPH